MPGGESDEPALGSQRPCLYHVLGAGGKPEEGDVGASIEEPRCRVGPLVHAKDEAPVGPKLGEAGGDRLVEATADARLEADTEKLAFLARARSCLPQGLVPFLQEAAGGGK